MTLACISFDMYPEHMPKKESQKYVLKKLFPACIDHSKEVELWYAEMAPEIYYFATPSKKKNKIKILNKTVLLAINWTSIQWWDMTLVMGIKIE